MIEILDITHDMAQYLFKAEVMDEITMRTTSLSAMKAKPSWD